MYEVGDECLSDLWKEYASAYPDVLKLLNSFLIPKVEVYPIEERKNKYLVNIPTDDRILITEIAEYRGDVNRSVIFKSKMSLNRMKLLA